MEKVQLSHPQINMTEAKPTADSTSSRDDGEAGMSSTAPTMNRQFIRAAVLIAILAVSVMLTKSDNNNDNDDDDETTPTIQLYLHKYNHILTLLHLFSFASWFGCSMWVSFIAGIVMFQNLPRHTFGRLQAKLFPVYFLFSAILISIAMATGEAIHLSCRWSLGTILSTILMNLVYLEPQTTAVMFARHKVERRLGTGHEVGMLKPKDPLVTNDPELKELSKQFGMLHGLSTSMNLAALGVGCYWITVLAEYFVIK